MQVEIASSGTADSFIKATHVTKIRHAHEVAAACLYALIQRAYTDYSTSVGPNQNEADEEVALSFQEWCSMRANKCVHFDYWIKTLSFQEWCSMRANKCVHFDYWIKTLLLELLLLVYIRSIRKGNFDMYVESFGRDCCLVLRTGTYALLKVAVRTHS